MVPPQARECKTYSTFNKRVGSDLGPFRAIPWLAAVSQLESNVSMRRGRYRNLLPNPAIRQLARVPHAHVINRKMPRLFRKAPFQSVLTCLPLHSPSRVVTNQAGAISKGATS